MRTFTEAITVNYTPRQKHLMALIAEHTTPTQSQHFRLALDGYIRSMVALIEEETGVDIYKELSHRMANSP
jgi:hypothetical protein